MNSSLSSFLIIDDDETDQYILSRWLKQLGYESPIHKLNNGQEALEFFIDHEKENKSDQILPALIFLDVNMPLMGGFEFLEHFKELATKEEKYTSSIIVIMITSSNREEDKNKANSYTIVKNFLVKGQYNKEKLKELVNEFDLAKS